VVDHRSNDREGNTLFHAERHPIEDNYQLTIAGSYKNRSVCAR